MATVTLSPRNELLRLDPNDGRLKTRSYTVKVVAGPDAGRSCALLDACIVGTGEGASLVLADDAVSRHHLELRPMPNGVAVRDLGSKNGTFIAAVRLQEVWLDGPRDIELGRTVLRLEFTEEDAGVADASPSFGTLQGVSPAMQRLYGLLARIAPSDSTVLLTGETGVGKTAVARAIHAQSQRAQGPFVVVDCGALPKQLIESELFGHVRGAFTGAISDRPGLALQAHRGVLFVDEIAELPLELQPRLLRLLESHRVRRLGDTKEQQLDVRIIAATHRDLRDEVKQGRFREDLYYRLAVVEVTVPPLRERPTDIAPLAQRFIEERGQSFSISPALLARMQAYGWPGNVRELRNVVERVLAGSEPGDVLPQSASGAAGRSFKEAKERVVEEFIREYLGELFARHRGNISAVAREAGLSRNHVTELATRLGLKSS
jgi:DNA-binding NtrC family response regulator